MIDRPRVYERVASEIEAAITRGDHPYGDKLPSERELMQQFGVSRASVREALFALQTRGFISISAGSRPRVTRPDTSSMLTQLSGAARNLIDGAQGMSHFQEARMLFECALARYAARHATPKHIEILARALTNNKRAIGDPNKFAETDMAFHLVLGEIAGNPIFTALHHALGEWLVDQRLTGMKIRGAIRAVYRDHERIFEAVERHDADGAEEAMATHLTNVARYYWKAQALSKDDRA